MYSILLRLTNTTAQRYKYLTLTDGSIYAADTLEEIQLKVVELLESYLLSDIKVVKNCVITSNNSRRS